MPEVRAAVAPNTTPLWLTLPGLGVLFGKLQQGVQENQQILTVARMRADAEEAYGNSLSSITPATDRIGGGFSRDEGASVRKVCEHDTWRLLQANGYRPTRACAPRWRQPPQATRRLLPTSESLS
jgi:hypothetical protein